MDPEVLDAMAPMIAALAAQEPLPVGDWQGRRTAVEALFAALAAGQPAPEGVTWKAYDATAEDGEMVGLRWCAPAGLAPGGPAVLYLHGGGMILGNLDIYGPLIGRYVAASGVPMLGVEYRLAPEHPHPTPVEDCYAGLVWLHNHAAYLEVDPNRIAVMGDSAGGGLAAAVALLARDRGGPALSHQILVYPMLDDRTTTPDPNIAPLATWSYEDNATGWGALLGGQAGTYDHGDVPAYAAPARADDLAGLPPAYVEVGDLDLFRAEDVDYAARLAAAGVPAELHVHPGVPHAYEVFAPDSAVARRAVADRLRVLGAL
jgi:acetyl esterase/lipase